MGADLSATNSRDHSSLVAIHGFRVQSYGERISPGLKRALRRLAERGFHDPTCVVVKTPNGNRSGITHAGGRYVHPENPYSAEVMRKMRALGMEPPPLPFLVAPGECTLYHEWGHHIDRTWSKGDHEIGFSFRWFSRFYQLMVSESSGFPTDQADIRPVESERDANDAVVPWWRASSELFANLFEDWMRGETKIDWDECEPESMNRSHGHFSVKIALLPQTCAEAVRADTYRLFSCGIQTPVDLPVVRSDLFGDSTDKVVDRLRTVIARARAEQGGVGQTG